MPPSKQPKNVSDHFMFISNHDDYDEELEVPEEANYIRIDECFMEEMVKDTEVSVEVPEETDYVRIEECFMEGKHAFIDMLKDTEMLEKPDMFKGATISTLFKGAITFGMLAVLFEALGNPPGSQ